MSVFVVVVSICGTCQYLLRAGAAVLSLQPVGLYGVISRRCWLNPIWEESRYQALMSREGECIMQNKLSMGRSVPLHMMAKIHLLAPTLAH